MQIGNYIHYRFSHYKTSGLNYNGSSTPNPEIVFQQQRTKLLSSLPDRKANKTAIKSTLEAQLNFFFNSNTADQTINLGFTPEEQQQLHNAVIKIFEQAMASLQIDLNGASIDYNNLSATGGGSVDVMGEQVEFRNLRKNKLGGKKGKQTKESAVYRRILALKALRDSLAANQVSSNFIQRVNNLESQYEELINELSQSVGGESGIIRGKGSAILKSKSMSIKEHGTFIQEINDLIKLTKKTTDTQVTGYLGEYIPAISQYVANMVAEKGVQECLADLNNGNFNIDIITGRVVGDQRTRKVLQKSAVIGKKGNSSSTDAQIGDVNIRTNYTQDKVDVILDLPQNEKINASMKNINFAAAQSMGKGINIFSGTSSLNFLQDYPIFANHYLNITANLGRLAFDQAPSGLIKQAHEEMKMTIALHALTGNVWGQSAGGAIGKTAQAEILVVNDTSNKYGQFKVYFMSDILNAISKNLKLITIDGLSENNPNWWVGELGVNNNQAAFKRVANILAHLHTQKLKVSISFDAL